MVKVPGKTSSQPRGDGVVPPFSGGPRPAPGSILGGLGPCTYATSGSICTYATSSSNCIYATNGRLVAAFVFMLLGGISLRLLLRRPE